MRYDTDSIKTNLPPERYYASHLDGTWGKPTGRGWHLWNGLCPFHQDKRPGSLAISTITGGFKCFSCGESGNDIITFHMKANGIGFKEACNQLQGVSPCVM